jgi:organic hydroperoxide reductase OsmC/OhrA
VYGFGVPVKAKRSEYSVRVDREGRLCLDERTPTHFPPDWTAEHLVLAALARCILTALAYHARRAETWMTASADASGTITRRDDGSWGFVEIAADIDARLDPIPPDLPALLGRAECGCFIGSSLEPRPRYVWHVNGVDVEALRR